MQEADVQHLIQAAGRKDQKAQTRLINHFWVDVFSFVLKKVKDQTDADELTVSIFSKVLNKLDLYDPNFQFKTWVLTIAQNSIIDYWRRKSRGSEEVTDDLHHLKNDFERSPEELMISEEERSKIIRIVQGMDNHYRDIIRLRFFEEKSIKEIAEELAISQVNTKVRIMRAKKVLEKLLKESDLDD